MFKYTSNSREHQDLFILSVLDKKSDGVYVEIGAQHFRYGSNTYLLEKDFSWTGLSVEINKDLCDSFNKNRVNPCVAVDGTAADYEGLFTQYLLPAHIDFLQLDIDPYHQTFKALQQIPFEKRSFSIITYEHDAYRGGAKERLASRELLASLGYTLVMRDVMHDDVMFEDWYVNEAYMPNDTWKLFLDEKVPMNPGKLTKKYIDIFNSL